ncbi:MAG: hypothetical protein IJG62_02530 [Synergistaceae bacterium]|nr:hypothetical protein [Synergistaceae bacterium]MBQ6909461.1 hypothetical protein [Synergistaceae bacterium]MBR0043802.1 hypothetical protein [Synergistaceae bacterium]MBR0095693.1 hypothetical protein [Synergistaceae bacterium]MBR0220843.1 hypothetical protein [Synergistaceae bacterium]
MRELAGFYYSHSRSLFRCASMSRVNLPTMYHRKHQIVLLLFRIARRLASFLAIAQVMRIIKIIIIFYYHNLLSWSGEHDRNYFLNQP